MTLGNAKGIDLFAERDGRTVIVQVKSIAKRQNVGWPLMQDKVIPGIVYVFVCLNEAPTPPSYFIAASDEARRKVKQYATTATQGARSGVDGSAFTTAWIAIQARSAESNTMESCTAHARHASTRPDSGAVSAPTAHSPSRSVAA